MPFNSVVYFHGSSHHWRRKRLWFSVKGKRSNGRLADIPLCCKRRRKVQADTEYCVTGGICCSIVRVGLCDSSLPCAQSTSDHRQYCNEFGLAIHQNDHEARRRFVEWAQNEIAVVLDFHKRILFSDEAHFWLNGYVNKQNCRIWSEANPQVYVETPLHPEKLTVWCALWAGGIIGPYFFKNDEGHNVTVNGDRYRAMITNFFIPELNNHDVQEP
ncbi:transposable element Tc3 transposase [Trichonephila clavipes]|nr:transposable element Tc3 transposase [Trichonephila clavipes]